GADASRALRACTDWGSPLSRAAAPVSARSCAAPAREASATLADAGGLSAGQATTAAAAAPARASAEPAAISVSLGGLEGLRWGFRRWADKRDLCSGALAPSFSTRAQTSHQLRWGRGA